MYYWTVNKASNNYILINIPDSSITNFLQQVQYRTGQDVLKEILIAT